ncbi:hypothetical protein HY500_00835 [Candidatus Woesearchaeota archaeon]|nr:hypothetical protein [Candidatus Woesearchaeota archaeon]
MRMRHVVGSLLTLTFMGLNDVGAIESQDGKAILDTVKVCVTNVLPFGDGVYFDFPDRNYAPASRQHGNYMDAFPFNGGRDIMHPLILDGTLVGVYFKTRNAHQARFIERILTSALNDIPTHEFFTRPVQDISQTDLPKFLDGYMENMNPSH